MLVYPVARRLAAALRAAAAVLHPIPAPDIVVHGSVRIHSATRRAVGRGWSYTFSTEYDINVTGVGTGRSLLAGRAAHPGTVVVGIAAGPESGTVSFVVGEPSAWHVTAMAEPRRLHITVVRRARARRQKLRETWRR